MDRVADASAEVARLRYEMGELVATARALSSERDIRKLLGLILQKCRQVTGADAGSVYVLEGEGTPAQKRLHFMLSQNDSLDIDFQEFTLEVDQRSIVGKAVLDGRPINITDLDALDDRTQNPWGFHHNRSFDQQTGYRARSMLTVPMLSAHSEVIGVVQLINCKRHPDRRLTGADDFADVVIPFDARAEEFTLALASQAGISLENALLYREIRDLFEGFVDASVTAIESRDPTTSGHSRRVATLSVALAKQVDAVGTGPLAQVSFSAEALTQLEYAGMLHDFGKVAVREKVLVKAKKLHDEQLQGIGLRFAYIRKSLQAEALEDKLQLATGRRPAVFVASPHADGTAALQGPEAQMDAVDRQLVCRWAELDAAMALVVAANEPTVMEQRGAERLVEVAALQYRDDAGVLRPYLESDELAALQIRRGSLTAAERSEIESHVVHTYNFLRKIPWARALRQVPRIAGAHHEYLSGEGYPERMAGAAIPLEARIMTIADIFDALTAADRPYKRAVPVDRALAIIEAEVRAGKVDGPLFELFVGGGVYKVAL